MLNTNFAERDISDAAKACLYKLKYEDAVADLKLAEAKIERLQNKIDYLNRCPTSDEADATHGLSKR